MFKSYFNSHPMFYPVMGFVVLILIGTILLMLPFSSHSGLYLEDALFLASSASCVNGLTTISVGNDLTLFGQCVLIFLMQIGGIGIMAISTLVMLVLHSRINFNYQEALVSSYSTTNNANVNSGNVVKKIIAATIIIELLGAVLLFTQFSDMPLLKRIFYSMFHSVSAFCNAGFSLWDNSMQNFAINKVLNITLMFLIICGGFGFLSLSELISLKKNKIPGKKLTLHTQIILFMTVFLIVSGMVLFLTIEQNTILSSYSIPDKILISVFQSVTSRTAGLSTVDFSMLGVPAVFLIILFMFIGANPGSCGGGIKTTTAAIIIMLGINRLLGRKKTQVLNHTIPEETVESATGIFILSVAFLALTGFLFFIFETYSLGIIEAQDMFLKLCFELVSAFTTCGLSMGITPNLTFAGKILISIVMFVGRLGPLVLAQVVVQKASSGIYYSEENVMVG